MIKIPLDVLRNFSNENFEDFVDDENFRYCLWSGKGWNDREYWKLEQGLLQLIELNCDREFQDKINSILEKIIYVYFGISSDWYFIDFEECDTQKSDNDLSIRIERFKFLILALMTNDVDLIKNKPFEYSPDTTKPQKKKSEKLDLSNYTQQITLEIYSSRQKSYYFLAEINNIFHANPPTMIKDPPLYTISSPCYFFLLTTSLPTKEGIQKIQEELEPCKIAQCDEKGIAIYQVPLDTSVFSLYISNPKSNRLFYMRLKRGYGIFNSILQSYPNDEAKLQNLIKREGGVYFDYQDLGNKQVLNLHFHWKKYKSHFLGRANKRL